jgi:hypothetical protein
MINADEEQALTPDPQHDAVAAIVGSGARGAVALAGIAAVLVLAMWFAFYLFVFVPRATAP